MTVINQSRQTTLTHKLITPTSLLDQTLGLLKYKNPTAMLLRTRYGIHTLGMRYAIDVLILNKDNQVIVLKKDLKPNRIFIWSWKYNTILELPKGTIEKTKTEINDIFIFS